MKIAIVNLGQIVSGDWRNPFVAGDTILTDGDRIVRVGTASAAEVESADVVIDAGGMTAIPGLINSHVHITFGDYTPRQRTVGFLESYLHGGITTAISASEVHVPGRPSDPEGVKALAIAAQRCFAHYRPGGMRVIAGSVILEPGLDRCRFRELGGQGRDAGQGRLRRGQDRVRLCAAGREAKAAGLITTCHTGGSSIPGSGAITGDHLLAMQPHVSFHINGGPTAMPDADFERVIRESEMALQVCTAGNLRTVLLCAPPRRAVWRFRSLHHGHRYADRLRHHAARPALHDRALREPDRYAAGAFHLRGHGQQCARLRPRFTATSPPARRPISC